MSTSDQIRVEPGTGKLTTQVKQPTGTTTPSDFSGRAVGGTSNSVNQDVLNQLQIGTLGGGASLYGRREANTFFFRGLEGENGVTVRTTPNSIIIGLEDGAGGGNGNPTPGAGLPPMAGNEGLYLRVGAAGLEWASAQGEQGPAGPQGPAGADGVDGVDGAPGPQGPKGDKGDKLSIDIVVEAVEDLETVEDAVIGQTAFVAGDSKIYVYSGTEWIDGGEIAAIQGPAGPQGEAGPQGPQGPQGEQGPAGPQGPAGESSASRLVDLEDMPSITGQGGKVLAVNTAGDGFEFVTPAAGGEPGAGTGNATRHNFRINFSASGTLQDASNLPSGWTAQLVSPQEIRVSTGSSGHPKSVTMWTMMASGLAGKYVTRSWGVYPQSSVVYYDPAVPNSFTVFIPTALSVGAANSGHVLIDVII